MRPRHKIPTLVAKGRWPELRSVGQTRRWLGAPNKPLYKLSGLIRYVALGESTQYNGPRHFWKVKLSFMQ